MRYILAYFALMLGLSGLSLLWAGNAYGFVLVLISAALIYVLIRMERMRRRERRYGGYGEAIEGYELRFSDE
jgi:asparagine N-glycosylation enzyme membrane subunit Stt3